MAIPTFPAHPRPFRSALAVAAAVWVALAGAPAGAQAQPTRSAKELEGRLIAPCCWVQTLDTHDSELATELRAEIRRRLAKGESSLLIEDDFAARYTERIRAVPRGRDPRRTIPAVVAGGMVLSLLVLVFLGWRWKQRLETRARANAEPEAEPRVRDEYDDRVEAELSRLGEA